MKQAFVVFGCLFAGRARWVAGVFEGVDAFFEGGVGFFGVEGVEVGFELLFFGSTAGATIVLGQAGNSYPHEEEGEQDGQEDQDDEDDDAGCVKSDSVCDVLVWAWAFAADAVSDVRVMRMILGWRFFEELGEFAFVEGAEVFFEALFVEGLFCLCGEGVLFLLFFHRGRGLRIGG